MTEQTLQEALADQEHKHTRKHRSRKAAAETLVEGEVQNEAEPQYTGPKLPTWMKPNGTTVNLGSPVDESDVNPTSAQLLRDNGFKQMAIVFDKKPSEGIIERLRNNGLKWKNDFNAWCLPLERGREGLSHRHAEQVFLECVNSIRETRGIESFEMVGVSQAR